MRSGDLVRRVDDRPYSVASVLVGDTLFNSFTIEKHDVGIVLNPSDWGGYAKVLMRNSVVFVNHLCLKVVV